MMKMVLPDAVASALKELNKAGCKAYVVGGCVRDAVMGITPHDFDICTSANPEEVKKVFSASKVFLTGEKHGTVTVLYDGLPLEITTFRTDGEYLDGRHPARVDFSEDVTEDLRRRDFTINAMAYHPEEGLIDPFSGEEDCKNKVLRCVGDAETRFSEDSLRLLRALRFAARFDLSIEGNTARALHVRANTISRVSRERVANELNGLLMAPTVRRVMMEFADVIFSAIPELKPMQGCPQNCVYHRFEVWEHTLYTVEYVPRLPVLRWAALLHDCGKPSTRTRDKEGLDHFYGHPKVGEMMAEKILKSLKMPTDLTKEVCLMVRRHDEHITENEVKSLLSELGPERFEHLIALQRADQLAHSKMIAERSSRLDAVLAEEKRILDAGECYTVDMLAVNGQDLKNLGMEGVEIGDMLRYLLDAVVRFHVPNDHGLLLQAANAHFHSQKSAFEGVKPQNPN